MAPAVEERIELAKLCSSRDWSKAIRILDSLLSQSFAIQDICNRAFCYSQLELHKHVIKDCDKALQLDPTLLQAYILKGRAFSALGRKEDAFLVWEQGHEHALGQASDLKQLLELEELLSNTKENGKVSEDHATEPCESSVPGSELLSVAKENGKISEHNAMESCESTMPATELLSVAQENWKISENHAMESCVSSMASEAAPAISSKSSDTYKMNNELSGEVELSSKSDDTSEVQSKSNGKCVKHNESSDKIRMNGKFGGRRNGTSNGLPNGMHCSQSDETYGILSNSVEELCRELSDTCNNPPVISSKSSSISEICRKPTEKSHDLVDEAKKNKKFSVARISKTKSISVDFRLSRGIAQVNEGRYAHAIAIFDQILNEDPTYPEALIGRGTAYAFQRELDAAIADFTRAIQSNPSAGEAWKRRGQARAALGESAQAISDLTKALEFEPNSADILHERGIVNFKFKDFNAAIEDLSACVQLDEDNKSAYTYLGSALSSIGEYRRAEEAHMQSIKLDPKFLEARAHLTQFYQDQADSEKALECLQQVLEVDGRFAKAYYLRGLLRHGLGEHRNAIKDLSLGLSLESSNIECLYLRASCHHAIGEYKEAVKDYDAALDLELDSMEKFVLQCLAFYQKEIALYTAAKITCEFSWFNIDADIDPLFKEYWCKRLHPKDVCEKVYRQPPLRESLRKYKLRKQDVAVTKQKTALLQFADSIGKKIQYNCPGFLPNKRQHRMAGLAAIEIAQKVSKAWRSLQGEWKHSNKSTSKYGKKARRKEKISIPSQNRGGAGCSTSSSSETSTLYGITLDRSSGRATISWHDIYSIAVRWRQISEPCDPVFWVNKLSEEFNSGFGSHTPLIIGQAKVVRYFPNYERTLDVAKAVIKEKMHVYSKGDTLIDLSKDGKLQEIMNADSCSALYRIVGQDFWLATWCKSTAFEGKRLEGTRITLVKMGEHGFDFAIRTPCTPSRWEEFEAEMTVAWEALCNAYCGETYGSTDFSMLENVRDSILRMTYYWYNFMPLSRGSAAVGFVVLLGLFLAANMEFTGSIPEGLQVDWEAILSLDPNSFVDSVKSWLYPSLKVTTSLKEYSDVASTFETTGSVVTALSSCND